MWRPSPQAPGPAMEASGHFHTSCASPLPIGPLADWQIIPRPPFNPLQLAPAAVMVCTPCYGNISHSHSQSHSDFLRLSLTHTYSHTHPYSRSSSHPYPIRPPSSPPRQYLPSPAFPICLLPPQGRPKASFQHRATPLCLTCACPHQHISRPVLCVYAIDVYYADSVSLAWPRPPYPT